MSIRNVSLLFVAILMATCLVPSARADATGTVTKINLNVDFCSLACIVPAGSVGGVVTLTQVSQTEVQFDVSLTNLNFHQTGGLDAFVFNYKGAGDLQFSVVTAGYSAVAGPGSYHEDGAGYFQYMLAYGSQPATAGSTLTFTVSVATGTLSLSDFLTTNPDNRTSAVDFAANVTNGSCTGMIGGGNGTAQTIASNPATGDPCSTPNVPEPTSIAFFGTGLIALGFVIRKRFSTQN